jgi:ABC-type transporter Mla maintaining outer membrane lipid asymmetry permease subunit MlaE
LSNGRHHDILLQGVRKFGSTAVFLMQLLVQCVPAFARPRLIVFQVYNTGARSLIIIMLSGLFVGMVLASICYRGSAPRRRWAPPRRSAC